MTQDSIRCPAGDCGAIGREGELTSRKTILMRIALATAGPPGLAMTRRAFAN